MTSLNVEKLILTTITPACSFTGTTSPVSSFFSSPNIANTNYIDNIITANIVPIYKAFSANSITSTVTQKVTNFNSTFLSVSPTAGTNIIINPTVTTLNIRGTIQSQFTSTWNYLVASPAPTKMLSGSGTFSGNVAGISFSPAFVNTPLVVLTITQGTTAGVSHSITTVSNVSATLRCSQNYTFNWVAIGT